MYNHVLVPLDGSKIAEQVLPHVQAIANKDATRLTLLRSVSRIPSHTIDLDRTAKSPLLEIRANEAEAQTYLDTVANELRTAGYQVTTVVIEQNDPHEAIIDFALANGVDIITMATHGRNDVGRFIFGSVAEKVLHQSPLPLLVVRPKP
jgi:nucleotide-binding universal stress UspA family protein